MPPVTRSDVLAAAVRGERFSAPVVTRPTSAWASTTAQRTPSAIDPRRVLDNARSRVQLYAGRRDPSPSVYYPEQSAAMRAAAYRNNPAILATLPYRAGLPQRRIFAGVEFPPETTPPTDAPRLTRLLDRLLGRKP